MDSMALEVGMPVIVSMLVYCILGWILKEPISNEVKDLETAIADI